MSNGIETYDCSKTWSTAMDIKGVNGREKGLLELVKTFFDCIYCFSTFNMRNRSPYGGKIFPLVVMLVLCGLSLPAYCREISGDIRFPNQWTAFGPFFRQDKRLSGGQLKTIPAKITVNGKTFNPNVLDVTNNKINLRPLIGRPEKGRFAYIFIPLETATKQNATLGFGSDRHMQVRLDGKEILNTASAKYRERARRWPPHFSHFTVTVPLSQGKHVLATRFESSNMDSLFAAAGPNEIRRFMARERNNSRRVPSLYRELLSDKKQPLSGESGWSFYFPTLPGRGKRPRGGGDLRIFALQYGQRYMLDDLLGEFADHRLHPHIKSLSEYQKFSV